MSRSSAGLRGHRANEPRPSGDLSYLSDSQGVNYSERMEERTVSKPRAAPRVRSQRFRAGAVILLAVVGGLVLWLALRGDNGSSNSRNASAVTEADLRSLAASLKQPIFWVGPREGYTYELVRLQNGTINVRYLPSGVDVGTEKPYLSIATYPFQNAYDALKNIKSKDAVFVRIPKRGIAEYSKTYPQSVHAAYPGVDYQVEVYDPTPGTATGLLVSGELAYLGPLTPKTAAAAPKPTATSPRALASLAKSLGHPIYWVGAKQNYTYELTQTPSGKVFIRYLPPGVKIGAPKPYLSVGTYPVSGAFAVTKDVAKNENTQQMDVPGGGFAVYDKGYPQSIHLAFPKSDFQIEVYDPSAARARTLVSSGRVRAIG
jgi:hypothetical protein